MNASTEVGGSALPGGNQQSSGDLVQRIQGVLESSGRIEDVKRPGTSISGHGELGSQKMSIDSVKEPSLDLKKPPIEAVAASKPKTDPSGDKSDIKKKRSRKKWKKPKGKPNRPLSAYNLFFQAERAEMLGDDAKIHEQDKTKKRVHRKTHGKVGFAEMARVIGQKWKELPEEKKKPFMEQAAKEKERYAVELKNWQSQQEPKSAKSKLARLQEAIAEQHDGSSSATAAAAARRAASAHQDDFRFQQMMAERRNSLSMMQQEADAEYLRALQEQRLALLASRSNLDSALYHHYPSAAEASANAILQKFQNDMSGSALSGAATLGGMNSMGMASGMYGLSPWSPMNPINRISAAAELQQQLGPSPLDVAADQRRLRHLRASIGATNPATGGGVPNLGPQRSGGDVERMQQQLSSQYPGNGSMTAAMMRRLHQNQRYSM